MNVAFPVSLIYFYIQEENVDPLCLYPGHDHEPVLCMARMGRRVFLSCGTQLLILNSSKGIAIEKIIETNSNRYVCLQYIKFPSLTFCSLS